MKHLFGKVNMIVDMVNAETVISRTPGTVTELKSRIFRVCASADSTFVMVKLILLLLTDLSGFSAEINRRLAAFLRDVARERSRKENKEVQNRNDREQIHGERIRQYGKQKICRIDHSHVFHLDWNKIEKKYSLFRKQRSIRKEHRQIQVLRVDANPVTADEVYEKTVNHHQRPANQNVYIELGRSPVLFERGPHPVVKIENKKGEEPHVGGIDHEGNQPPDLTAQDQCRIKAEIAHQRAVRCSENPEYDIGYGQIAHQIGNAEIRMPIAELVNQPHGIFQGRILQNSNDESTILFFKKKVYKKM